jgi:hypothetical protein
VKKLALLFLILPISACASQSTDQLRVSQAIEARNACTAQDKGPASPDYGPCINTYLFSHYRWQVGTNPDGSLAVYYYRYQPVQRF